MSEFESSDKAQVPVEPLIELMLDVIKELSLDISDMELMNKIGMSMRKVYDELPASEKDNPKTKHELMMGSMFVSQNVLGKERASAAARQGLKEMGK